nr:glycosyltransferase [Cytobacillus oceanisediminis]
MPLVSVLIPFYNCQYVNQAINSALRQTYKNIEIIIVNDGSYLYKDLVTPFLSNIIYLEQKNKGVASALNKGIKKARGEYLAWLSSDDIFNENKIQLQLNFMIEKNSFFSFTNFNIIDSKNHIIQHNVGINFKTPQEVLQKLKYFNPINGCTVMMSRKIIEAVGFFDEKLKYAQDYDYWIRVSNKFPLHYFHYTLTNYRVHDSMGSIRHNKEQMKEFYEVRSNFRKNTRKFLSENKGEKRV